MFLKVSTDMDKIERNNAPGNVFLTTVLYQQQ